MIITRLATPRGSCRRAPLSAAASAASPSPAASGVVLSPYEPLVDLAEPPARFMARPRIRFLRWAERQRANGELFRTVPAAARERDGMCAEAMRGALACLGDLRERHGLDKVATPNVGHMMEAMGKKRFPRAHVVGVPRFLQMVFGEFQVSNSAGGGGGNLKFVQATYLVNTDVNLLPLAPRVSDPQRWHLTIDPKSGNFYHYNGNLAKWTLQPIERVVKMRCPFDFGPYAVSVRSPTRPAPNPDGSFPMYAVFEIPVHRTDIPWRLHAIG